jgi:hypothetical protein
LDIFWNCLTFKTDILLNWFCMFISDKAVWNSLKLRFEKFNFMRFYWLLIPFLQYLVLEYTDTWPWISLKSPWIWLSLTCTNPTSNILFSDDILKCIWHEISYFLEWKNSLSCSVTYFSVSCFYGLFTRYLNLFDM